MKKVIYLLLIISLIFTSCSKDESNLPLTIYNIGGEWNVTSWTINGSNIMCPTNDIDTCIQYSTISFSIHELDSITSTSYISSSSSTDELTNIEELVVDSGEYNILEDVNNDGNYLLHLMPYNLTPDEGPDKYFIIEKLTEYKLGIAGEEGDIKYER